MQVGQNVSAYRVKREIAISDIYFIESMMNKMIEKICLVNFNTGNLPKFSIDKSKPIDLSEHLNIIKHAYEMGYKLHPDEFSKLGLFRFNDQKPIKKEN